MTQCNRYALMGPQCELEAGHDGPHRKTSDDRDPFEWTDESVRRQVAAWERSGGTWD